MPDTRGLALGLASHLLAGVSPFLMAAVIAQAGLLPGTALAYVMGTAVLSAGLVAWPARRRALVATTRELARTRPTALLGSLAGFLVAGVAYYVGLASSARVAEYVFLTRLDWTIQAPVAMLLLREPWTPGGLMGAALALTGGLVIVWTGAIGASGLGAALVYVVASLAGYLGARAITRASGLRGALSLTVWRHLVNTLGFVGLALVWSRGTPSGPTTATAMLAVISGLVLVGLFATRFASLTRLPLWVLSAQAPVQALVALSVTYVTGGRIGPATWMAVGLIVAGEWLVARGYRVTTPAR